MHTVYIIYVKGLVQGVGFRPYVCQLGQKLNAKGCVSNIGGQVLIKVYDDKDKANALISSLKKLTYDNDILPGSNVKSISLKIKEEETIEEKAFFIDYSSSLEGDIRFIPVDYCTCNKCQKELLDPHNRRYKYPFISCVSCGPRISIIEDIPYDRDNITLKEFPMCKACEDEYTKVGDRRHFAQTIGCNDCGPKLMYKEKDSEILYKDEALNIGIKALKMGKILAIKDIGGYHFVCDARNVASIKKLRQIKKRQNKPFAVMFKSVEDIKDYAIVNEKEKELLESNARPIVLLRKKETGKLPEIIDDDSSYLGAMLPVNPLQILLMMEFDALIMTSGNLSKEPIIKDDKKALKLLDLGLIDGCLYNNRKITNSLDDSIMKVTQIDDTYITQIIRRARGFVPTAIRINKTLKEECFAAGGDLKSVFALAKKNYVTLSGHFGDLIDLGAFKERNLSITRFMNLLNITPKEFICDKHSGYLSNKECHEFAAKNNSPVKTIQHHHAHIASVMAEHNLEKTIGIALDGTGLGNDGCIWGGEFLYCKDKDFVRMGHLDYISLIGGDLATTDIDKSAAVSIMQCIDKGIIDKDTLDKHKFLREFFNTPVEDLLRSALDNNINSYRTSSCGRLFDIISVILGIKNKNTYEGEAPIKLEECAYKYYEKIGHELPPPLIAVIVKEANNEIILDTLNLIGDIYNLYMAGGNVNELAFEFINSLATALVNICLLISKKTDCMDVSLSGGCFNNSLLLTIIYTKLKNLGFNIYTNNQVPCGDGGIALGQVYLA